MPPAEFKFERRGEHGRRGPYTLHFNFRQVIVHHSPAGMEWGYGGSGPADAALNILHLFLPPGCDGQEPVRLWQGECSQVAWNLHQEFKRLYVATLPDEGGVIAAEEVERFIKVYALPPLGERLVDD